jgi:membrane-bound inhibitor of C-type lysozyme
MPRVRCAVPVIGALLSLSLIAGCANLQDQIDEIAGDNDDNDGPRTVAYECDDNREFTARFSGDRDNVRVDTGGQTYDLEYDDSDGGTRTYIGNNDVELRVDNENAYLRIPGESDFEDCERS